MHVTGAHATGGPSAAEAHRRQQAAAAGHRGAEGEPEARRLLADPSPRVRATALAALARLGRASPADIAAGLADPHPHVRRRACAVAAAVGDAHLVPLLDDPDAMVVEAAAWALGEFGMAPGVADALAGVATSHADALCREAAVAALGAVGDPAGLPAILAATSDKAAVRRRAVLALAPFEGPEVEAALARALDDRDWQVRQAAEDLLGAGGAAGGEPAGDD